MFDSHGKALRQQCFTVVQSECLSLMKITFNTACRLQRKGGLSALLFFHLEYSNRVTSTSVYQEEEDVSQVKK